jgi:signal transduction histidine kinase
MRSTASFVVRWFSERPIVFDSVLALTVTAFSVVWVTPLDVPASRDSDALAYTLAILGTAPLVWRRRYPVAVLAVMVLALGALFAIGHKTSLGYVGVLFALYTMAGRRPLYEVIGMGTASVAVLLVGSAIGLRDTPWVNLVFGATQGVFVVALSRAMQARSQYVARLEERAERMARERRLEAERAVAQERVQIALELPDVAAHHLSVISVQANVARYVLHSNPTVAHNALTTIATTTTESLDELRRLLYLLDPQEADATDATDTTAADDAEEFSPQPCLADLEVLAGRVRDAGVPVQVRVDGEARQLPPGAQLCAYRVAQEALTNVIKHAGAASAVLALDFEQNGLSLRVTDDGPAVRASLSESGEPRAESGEPRAESGEAGAESGESGHGLIGMRERARIYGGTVHSRVRPEGGFEVVLRLPYLPSDSPATGAIPVPTRERFA